ncbi:MAG: hypothetical protein WC154_07175 [Candidatus Izemoplasmatales bacterium]
MKNTKKQLLEIYKEIEIRITKIDFDNLYKGFSVYDFALYNEKYVVLKDRIIPYDSRFVGNTSIEFEGKIIAIWRIDSIYIHYNVLASKIVHEMFHAFQMSFSEKRFPNEFQGLFYHYEKYNISMKFDETKFLLMAYDNDDLSALRKFVSLREKRRRDYEIEINFEEGIETIEGMAKYIELKALQTLDIEEYEKAYDKLKEEIKNIKNYLPIRSVSYSIGALIIMTAERFKKPIYHLIGEEDKNIYHLYFDETEHLEFYYEHSYNDLQFLENYYQGILSRISMIFSSNPKVYECDQVIGFDPMNSYKVEKYIYYRHFVMIRSQGKDVFIRNESIGELNEDNQVYIIYEINR